MSTIVRCKGCGKQLRLSERMAGRQVACPACRTKISVPETFSSPDSDPPASEDHPASETVVPPTTSRTPQSRSPEGPKRIKPPRSPESPRRQSNVQHSPPAQPSDDPFSAVSISSGPTGAATSSRTSRRGRSKKKNQSQKVMLQCGIGFGVFLVLVAVIFSLSGSDDQTESLKSSVYKRFNDCENEKLLKQLVEKHHAHCVDACTDKNKQVDRDKYVEMMWSKVGKDLFDKGIKGYWSG